MFDVPGRSRLLSSKKVSEKKTNESRSREHLSDIFPSLSFCRTLVTDNFPSAERTCAQVDLSSVTSPPTGIPFGFYDSFNVVVYPIVISPYTPFSFLFACTPPESSR